MTVELTMQSLEKKTTCCPHDITVLLVHPSENDPDFSHSSVTQGIIAVITKQVLH